MGTVCKPCAARCQWLHADELKHEAERREIAAEGERMRAPGFQVGDEVEVRPAPGAAYDDWQYVSRRRGVVETVRDGGVLGCRSVRVRFSSDHGGVDCLWWCDPAWLRRVPAQEPPITVPHGKAGCPCACCRYAFRCAALGHPEKDPGADSRTTRHDPAAHERIAALERALRPLADLWLPNSPGGEECLDVMVRGAERPYYTLTMGQVERAKWLLGPTSAYAAPSRPQEARSAPCDCCGDVAAYRVCGRCFDLCSAKCCSSSGPGSRYRVGDLVDMGEFKRGEVLAIDAEPRYSVQWPDGHVQRIKESTLSPHKPAPVVCAPDGTRCAGTRCAWMADTMHRLEAHTGYPIRNMVIVFPDGCPVCKGRF